MAGEVARNDLWEHYARSCRMHMGYVLHPAYQAQADLYAKHAMETAIVLLGILLDEPGVGRPTPIPASSRTSRTCWSRSERSRNHKTHEPPWCVAALEEGRTTTVSNPLKVEREQP